tara:strand:+ start:271 stop:1137 length:867 start_codon:yes stop_codon:yes gene_type:complete
MPFSFNLPSISKVHSAMNNDVSELENLVFVLALESEEDTETKSWSAESALNAIVKFAQPAPAIAHVEILFPPFSEEMHFSTYMGTKASYGSAFDNQRSFYLGSNSGRWRAIPLSFANAASRLRSECDIHVGTEYTLLRYMLAVPPFRAITSMFSDKPKDFAHCATLTARCIRRAFPELGIMHPSAWYGPSTLALELDQDTHVLQTRSFLSDRDHNKSVGEEEELSSTMVTLLHGPDEDVRQLPKHAISNAVFALSVRTVQPDLDSVAKRIVQKQLATALLRVSCARLV